MLGPETSRAYETDAQKAACWLSGVRFKLSTEAARYAAGLAASTPDFDWANTAEIEWQLPDADQRRLARLEHGIRVDESLLQKLAVAEDSRRTAGREEGGKDICLVQYYYLRPFVDQLEPPETSV